MPKAAFFFAILLALAAFTRPVGASQPAFISVDVTKTPSANFRAGGLSVFFRNDAGHGITAAVERQGYVHWALKQDGIAIDAASPLAAGFYDFVLNFGGQFVHHAVEIRPNHATVINIRPGVVHLTAGPFDEKPGTIRLIFTRAPELTAVEFRRNGCRPVTPNIALISEFQVDAAPARLYLPPGLYRVITQYDRRLKGGNTFLRVDGVRIQAARLSDVGLGVDPRVEPPVYHGKCYY